MKIWSMNINLIKQNKWFKRALWLVAGVIVTWVVAWLAVPPIVKSQVERIASEQLGRKVTLGSVDFKPWSLELTVNHLRVARAENAADALPQLLIKRLYIDATLQSLVRLAPVLDAIVVEAPHLNLTHLGEGHYDVDDISARITQPANKPESSSLKFALYNLALSDGSMDFTDKAVGKTHELRDLQIKLPFLSNLASQRTVLVQPQLAFVLNGSRFDSNAQTTPFAQTRKTDATLKLNDLDLAPYLGYLPASLPVKLTSGILNADIQVAFEQSPQMSVKLSGSLQAAKVKLVAQSSAGKSSKTAKLEDAKLLDFDLLKLILTDVRPLEQVAQLAEVELTGATLNVQRNPSGQLNLTSLFKPQNATHNIATNSIGTDASSLNDTKNATWKLDVAKVLLRSGAVHWTDESTAPVARLGLRDVTLEASQIALPFVQPVQFDGAAKLASMAGAPADKAAHVSFKGHATNLVASVNATLANMPLGLAAPYLAQFMTPDLVGTLDGELGVRWKASADPTQPAELLLLAPQLKLNDVALSQGKTQLASVKQVQLSQTQMNLERRIVTLGKLEVIQPKIGVGREADGRWMFESWLKTSSARTVDRATPPKNWGVAIQTLALDGGTVNFLDKSVPKPVAFDLEALSVALKNYDSTSKKFFQANVSTQIHTRRSEAGRLVWRGSASLTPLTVQGRVDAVRVPVHALEPYLADAVNIKLRKAETSFKGQVSYQQSAAGPEVKVRGDTTIEDFQANSVSSENRFGEELLNWKVLSLRGLDLAMAPGTATQVNVKETVLNDFFARLILSETGRFNLQDVMKSSAQANQPSLVVDINQPHVSTKNTTQSIAANPLGTGATALNDIKNQLSPVIRFGPVSLLGGRVYFSDRFIKPNYSANLTELAGKLSAFSSQTQPGVVNLADLELRGRAEGTASLEILGKINPLVKPLALDIKGRVRDLELPPLSPYSVRYAGYGIERGKLSVNVSYVVQPNGLLTATNNLVLNQLTFGDKVDGAPASLPVKLAVALLADRNGRIDLNLPISGSLNDPDFKLGPLVFKMIINLIGKAITSPFSLLASAMGGADAEELSEVSFSPGSAMLSAEAKSGLDKVVKILADRPNVIVTVVGAASLEAERDAFKLEQIKALVQAEKRRTALLKADQSMASAQSEGALQVTQAEYPTLLKAVYRRADFPKPRNLIGRLKDIPVEEMEALLIANLPANLESMHDLAVQRGVAVRDYLASQKLPLERLFLGAAKAEPSEAKWRPRAELNLTTQ